MDLKDLPSTVHGNLCRILDKGEKWRELAVGYMGYDDFDANEIRNESKRYEVSPTSHLLERWSHQVHTSNELFLMLYRMRQVPALRCMVSCVDDRCLRLLEKLERTPRRDYANMLNENINRQRLNYNVTSYEAKVTSNEAKVTSEDTPMSTSMSSSSIPLPVREMEKALLDQDMKRQQASTKQKTDNTLLSGPGKPHTEQQTTRDARVVFQLHNTEIEVHEIPAALRNKSPPDPQ